MANSLNKTKRRISSIEATEKTTKAMGLIAMVKLKRHLSAFESLNLYSKEYRSLMGSLVSFDKEPISCYFKVNKEASGSLYLVINSDLGLAGSYNSSIFKFVEKNVKDNDVIAPFGKKGINHYKFLNQSNLDLSYGEVGSLNNEETFSLLAKKIQKEFEEKKYRKICIIYTHYVNSLKAIPMVFQLLPISLPKNSFMEKKDKEVEFDGDIKEIIEELMPSYLTSQIFDKVTESLLSEQSTRRNAMDQANENADELLDKLKIEYNKARQSAITQEITEVVGGSTYEE